MFPTSEHPLSTCPMPAPALVAGAENSPWSCGGSSTEVPPQRDTSSPGTAAVQAPTPPRAGSRKTIATWKDGYEITQIPPAALVAVTFHTIPLSFSQALWLD